MAESLEVRVARLEERDRATRRALKLQAREYERRLRVLNNEYQRAEAERGRVVSIEKFESFEQRYEENKAVTAEALTLARGNQQGVGRFAGFIVGSIGAAASLAAIILVIGDVLTP